jgi:hypothetical protein
MRIRRNPFRRAVDQLDVAIRVMAVVLAALAVVAALGVGSAVRRYDTAVSTRAASGEWVTAVVLDRVPPVLVYTGARPTVGAPATWHAPDGTARTGLVQVEAPELPGARVRVWVDRSGRPSDPPMTADELAQGQLQATVTFLVLALVVIAGLWYLVHRRLMAARYALWAKEWERIGPQWTDRLREP